MSKTSLNYSDIPSDDSFIMPSKNNPMMNVPIINYDRPQTTQDYYRYDKYSGPKSQFVKEDVNQTWDTGLYKDPADMFFAKNNSQRQWYSMPTGTVPSDQTSFAENLYGREFVCKSGSIWMNKGVKYTDDSLACTGFEGDGQITNFGSLNRS